MSQNSVPLQSVLKGVVIISSPALTILALYVVFGTLSLGHFLYAYTAILILSAIFLRPLLTNVATLTSYVNDLAQDKRVESPQLGMLSTMTDLSNALRTLHQSFDQKKQQMENIITEREILVDSLPDILIMLGSDQAIIRTNKIARTRFGQNLAGKKLGDVIPNDRLINTISSVEDDLSGREVEFVYSIPEPRDYRAVVERFPVASAGGISIILTMNDVTEIKQLEKMRADFVANASHEIRTPLASIAGFIETLRGPAKDDEQARDMFLAEMAQQATRLTNLVTDLLSLSKVEMNAHSIPTGSVDVARLIRVEQDNLKWQANAKNMVIDVDLRENLPPARGDESELRQVVHNLLGNAIKYGNADSRVTVSAKLTSSLPRDSNFIRRNRAILISFIDQGEGIAREHLAHLTERFYRVDSARTRTIGGTGLGLAIVQHIIKRHRGALMIDSEVGVGSNFSVYVPLYEDE
jgi:two-component system phosphate regulon sensor histidine kinase PhoR